MTSASGSCLFSRGRPVRMRSEGVFVRGRSYHFYRQMNAPDVCCYQLLLDQQPLSTTARVAEHAEPAGGEYVQEFAARGADNACGASVRRRLYDQGPISRELPAGTVLQVRHRNRACLAIDISIGAPS